MKKQFIGLGIALILIVGIGSAVALGGKGNSNDQMSGMASPTERTRSANTISIKDYMFAPMSTTVKVGTKVTWTNNDAVAHTITADTMSSDAPESMNIAKNGTYSFTFTKAGTYTYHCQPHPYMKGTVTVTE